MLTYFKNTINFYELLIKLFQEYLLSHEMPYQPISKTLSRKRPYSPISRALSHWMD